MTEFAHIPQSDLKRIVIVGAGFAGLKLVRQLSKAKVQIVLIDKNNYHQFQPLFYQVATAGLEPSAISFPLRKVLQAQKNVHFRVARLLRIEANKNVIETDIGIISYDELVLAIGADTNFFGNENIKKNALPMKSVSEALFLRNQILQNYENALSASSEDERVALMNVVIVGGGPTGVELAGSLAEMRKFVLPKDYPELDFSHMKIVLLEAGNRLLSGMSAYSSKHAMVYLKQLGVQVELGALVSDFNGDEVSLADKRIFRSKSLLWAAGIKANRFEGLALKSFARGGRIYVNRQNRLADHENIYALGDLAFMSTSDYPDGHPQVAQVAIQQAELLAKNFKSGFDKQFEYRDRGSMATVGRNLAVCDLPFMKLRGFVAWVLWLFVHLMAILGAKNKLFIFINWSWSYLTYDQSLRLVIKPKN